MKQRLEIPLLKDNHNHFSFYMSLQDALSLQGVENRQQALDYLSSVNSEKLNLVTGYNSGLYSIHQNDIETSGPVIICNLSLHGFIMNSAAEKILKIDYEDIVNNYKDEDWCEKNLNRFFVALSEMSEFSDEKIKDYSNLLLKQGIYESCDMLLTGENIITAMERADLLHRTDFFADMNIIHTLSSSALKRVAGVKLFTDGALGVKTAALNRSFFTGEKGILLHSDEELADIILEAFSYKKWVAIHAIGDRAIDQVVRVTLQLRKTGHVNEEIRIEHCQMISHETALRARDAGIVLSMQPNFSYDSQFYTDRLPEYYVKANNPFRMLIDKCGFCPGKDLLFGSDGMPSGMNAALQSSLFPPLESQILTIDEFIAGYCSGKPDAPLCEVEIDEDRRIVSSCIK